MVLLRQLITVSLARTYFLHCIALILPQGSETVSRGSAFDLRVQLVHLLLELGADLALNLGYGIDVHRLQGSLGIAERQGGVL